MSLISLVEASKDFGIRTLFEDLTLHIREGDRVGLIGPNGAGKSTLLLAVGPMFAALTGIGFKEFFCFRRPEAVGLTLLLPVALLGRILGLIGNGACWFLVLFAGLLLVVLAVRKFGMEAAADVGDKSVFAYLDTQREVADS